MLNICHKRRIVVINNALAVELDIFDALEPVDLFADVGGSYECTERGCEAEVEVTQST